MIDRMKTRGERLKARRLELKMTLKQVAQSVGISLPGVQNLERGDVMPSLEIGLALA
ncbi:DNA-binding protein, partial [Klebsiella pneumoniae]